MDGVLKRVTPLEDFILEAEFTGGVVKRYDVKPLFDEPLELRNERQSRTVLQSGSKLLWLRRSLGMIRWIWQVRNCGIMA